jgi:integrase
MMGFPGVSSFQDRHGKTRFRVRKKGLKPIYLPGLPGSPEFAEAYSAAISGREAPAPAASRTKPGSVNALAVLIYASAEWNQMRSTTRVTYRGIIERFRVEYGELPVNRMATAHVFAIRDKRASSPAAANNLLKVLRYMLAFAVSRGWRPDNPAASVKPLRYSTEGFHTWSEDEIAAFESRWPVGSRERTAFDLLLYTAQRSGDVRRMGRQHIRDGLISVQQEKTGTPLVLPIHPRLAASLATVPSGQMLFLQTAGGAQFTAAGFGNWFRDACRAAGLPACSAHGLRKTAATRLADAGNSEARIMAVTGHKTTKEVQRYTAKRDQRRLAAEALLTLAGSEPRTKIG